MMKMDSRDSAEYQNWEMKGHNGHLEKSLVTKGQKKHSDCLLQMLKREKRGK